MKFKVTDFTVLFDTEKISGANVDESNKNTEQKEADKQKIGNLPQNVKDFLGLKGNKDTEVKISKNKKGEIIYSILYKDYGLSRTIKEKDILKLGDWLSKQKDALIYFDDMKITLLDILEKVPDDEQNYINDIIKDNIKDILKLKDGINNISIKKEIENKDFIQASLYYMNYRYGGIDDVINLVKIYDEKLLKGKTGKEKEDIINNIYTDLADGCENLDFYQNKKSQNIINKLKYGKELKVSVNVVGMYDRYLNLTDYSSDQLDLSESINNKIKFEDLEEYDNLGLEKKLVKGEKVSPNELIAINLILSGKEEIVKKVFDGDALNKIAKKFGFTDMKGLKKVIYKEQLKNASGTILMTNSNSMIDFSDVYMKISLNKAEKIFNMGNKLRNLDLNKKSVWGNSVNEVMDLYNNYKKNVLEILFTLNDPDKKAFLNVINGNLEKGGFDKITIKESNEQYKKKIDNLFLVMNNIGSTKIDFDKLLDEFSDNIECIDKNNAKKILRKMFSKDNIPKLREELSESNLSPMEFILQQLDQENFFENFKNKNKSIGDEEKHNMVYMMMGKFLEQIKGKQTLDIKKSLEENKQLNILIEDLGNNLFKDSKEGAGKIKKDLALTNLKYDIGKVLFNNNTDVLTKDFLVKHKAEILNLIKKQFGVNLKEQGNLNKYYKKIETLLAQLTEKLPSGGIKIDLDLKNLEQTRKLIESIEKDNKKYEQLGYEGYIEYQEKGEAEKKMLEHAGTQVDENVSLEKSLFKGEQTGEVQTKMKNEGGIYTLQMHIPGKKNVIEVKSLKLEEANKIIISKYIKNMFGFNLDLKGNSDELNKVISNQTDITKDGITSEDLEDTSRFLQNYIYETFYKQGNDKSKKFLKDNELNIYDLYNKPENFSQRFVKGMKKQVNMGGFQADFDKFNLDLNGLSENYFDKNLIQKNKEDVNDNGREFFKKKDSSIFSSLTNGVKKLFG